MDSQTSFTSEPSPTDKTQSLYTFLFVATDRLSSSKTALWNAQWLYYASIYFRVYSLPFDMITKPRYGNSSTYSTSPPLTTIDFLSSSSIPYPLTTSLVFGILTISPKSSATSNLHVGRDGLHSTYFCGC